MEISIAKLQVKYWHWKLYEIAQKSITKSKQNQKFRNLRCPNIRNDRWLLHLHRCITPKGSTKVITTKGQLGTSKAMSPIKLKSSTHFTPKNSCHMVLRHLASRDVVLCRWFWFKISSHLACMATRDWKACMATCKEKKCGFTGNNFMGPICTHPLHVVFRFFGSSQFEEEKNGYALRSVWFPTSSRSKSFSRFVAPSFHGSNNLKDKNSPFPTHSNARQTDTS